MQPLTWASEDSDVRGRPQNIILLQHCLLQDALRRTAWPEETPLKEKLHGDLFSSVQFSSVQDGIYALGKAYMRSRRSMV